MTDSAISVSHVVKEFVTHSERRSTLKERFVKGRSPSRGVFRALDDVSFKVPRGSTYGLLGHNGSGKSTMLKILAGVYRPSSGSAKAYGKVSALLELGAGFHGDLTGRENIFLSGAILGLSKKQIQYNVDKIIDFSGIGDFIDMPVKVYSSGMYVRLGFAVAVTLDPEILIVDEIIAVGDEEFQRKCFDYLYDLRKKGCSIVIVTHSMSAVSDLCDEASWLDHGKIKEQGDVNKVIDAYLYDVNQKEAARRAQEAKEGKDITIRAERQGSGEARYTRLEYLDSQGKPAPFLVPGKPATVRIHIHSEKELDDVEVGLGFVHEGGQLIAGPNSRQTKPEGYHLPKGDSYVDFTVDSLFLQPGNFWMNVSLQDSGHMYDYADKHAPLNVRASAAVTEPGFTRMLGTWSSSPVVTTPSK